MVHNNIEIYRKIEQAEFVICLQVTYPTYFCIICNHVYYSKNKSIWFFLNKKWIEQNFLCICSYDKWFALNLLLLCKAPSKTNDFLKDVESTVARTESYSW